MKNLKIFQKSQFWSVWFPPLALFRVHPETPSLIIVVVIIILKKKVFYPTSIAKTQHQP